MQVEGNGAVLGAGDPRIRAAIVGGVEGQLAVPVHRLLAGDVVAAVVDDARRLRLIDLAVDLDAIDDEIAIRDRRPGIGVVGEGNADLVRPGGAEIAGDPDILPLARAVVGRYAPIADDLAVDIEAQIGTSLILVARYVQDDLARIVVVARENRRVRDGVQRDIQMRRRRRDMPLGVGDRGGDRERKIRVAIGGRRQ